MKIFETFPLYQKLLLVYNYLMERNLVKIQRLNVDTFTIDEAIKYAKEHITKIPLGTLEYITDSDELDEENCEFEDVE